MEQGARLREFWHPENETHCGGNEKPFDQKKADEFCNKRWNTTTGLFRCKMSNEWTESSDEEKPDCGSEPICGRCHTEGNCLVSFVLFQLKIS